MARKCTHDDCFTCPYEDCISNSDPKRKPGRKKLSPEQLKRNRKAQQQRYRFEHRDEINKRQRQKRKQKQKARQQDGGQ